MRVEDDVGRPRSRPRGRAPGIHDDGGAVSGEFAAALPGAVLILTLLLGLGMHAAAQVTLEEGARAAARELARGETEASAREAVQRVAGESVQVSISRDGEHARVRLVRPVRLLGLVELSAEQTADASARVEQPSLGGGIPGGPP
ncbi:MULTISPECIES: TadE family type IV pilus minor pilin [Actinomycetes]|uniref:TadE family type IV pilus minor pilin n=2 Tax=Actinomycetes TaxID=1760 RepID=A0ABP6LYX4_9MICC